MRIFATRYAEASAQCATAFNKSITDLGREQARLLSLHLKSQGFNGKIYSSSEAIACESASIISKNVGAELIHVPSLGKTKDESSEEYYERLRALLHPLLFAPCCDGDVLIVCSSSVMSALFELFHPGHFESSIIWNLSISLLYSSSGEAYANRITHMPKEYLTAGSLIYTDKERELAYSFKKAEEFFSSSKGIRLLHIGDTHSAHYSHYESLISKTHPDVIVHTGDFADELKAGRVESDVERWKSTVPRLCRILRNSGARIIVVDGNNDVKESLLQLLPDAEFVTRNDTLFIDGVRICFSHEVWKLDPKVVADIYLYGHGRTYETRTKDNYEVDGRKYFNAVWGASLHKLSEDEHLILPEISL